MFRMALILAQATEVPGGAMTVFSAGVWVLVLIASFWRIFQKAGQPGWAILVPVYNLVVLCRVGGKPGWWVLWLLVPIVNIIVPILISIGIAQCFGRGPYFSLGLVFFWPFFVPVLAFGGYRWQAPA